MNINSFEKRKEKYLQEVRHLEKLEKKGLHNLEIADRLIHGLRDLMQQGIRNQFPSASEKQINSILKEEIRTSLEFKRNST